MKHVHVMDIRPDVITRTGVIQPYAVRELPPMQVARHSVRAFEETARPPGPRVRSQLQPEEFAARAKRLAVAMAAGKRPPRGTNRKLLEAAKAIAAGKSFAVRSAGRTAFVKGSPANRIVRDHRPTSARVVRDHRNNPVVRDHRGRDVNVRDHRDRGGFFNNVRPF